MFDIDCMVRPASTERNRLYRYLEDGATGFLIPFASNKEIAQNAVEAAKFPPLGNRGLDGAGLDGEFGLQAWGENSRYTCDANEQTFVFVQIETLEGLAKVDEIASVPGIDALFVGGADLGLRLRVGPKQDTVTLDTAIEQVAAAARRHGKAWGAAAGSFDNVRRYWEMGARVITWGGDFGLRHVLANCAAELKSALGE